MPDPKNEPDQIAFGAMFKKARERIGLSQQETADQMPETRTTQAYISNTENAQTNPPLLTMVALAKAVGHKLTFRMTMIRRRRPGRSSTRRSTS